MFPTTLSEFSSSDPDDSYVSKFFSWCGVVMFPTQVSSVRVQPPDHKQLLIYVITNGIVTLIK